MGCQCGSLSGGLGAFWEAQAQFFSASLASLASEPHLLSALQLNVDLIPKKGGRGTVCPGKGGRAGGWGCRNIRHLLLFLLPTAVLPIAMTCKVLYEKVIGGDGVSALPRIVIGERVGSKTRVPTSCQHAKCPVAATPRYAALTKRQAERGCAGECGLRVVLPLRVFGR